MYKISLYADDIILYLSDVSLSLKSTVGIIKDFGKISGYKINWGGVIFY